MPARWESRIPQISEAIPIKVGAAMDAGLNEMVPSMRAAAPRGETGELADSIEVGPGQSQFQPGQSFGIWARWYWFFSEFGTIHETAQPWLMPVFESSVPELLTTVREALAKS